LILTLLCETKTKIVNRKIAWLKRRKTFIHWRESARFAKKKTEAILTDIWEKRYFNNHALCLQDHPDTYNGTLPGSVNCSVFLPLQ